MRSLKFMSHGHSVCVPFSGECLEFNDVDRVCVVGNGFVCSLMRDCSVFGTSIKLKLDEAWSIFVVLL